MLRTSTTFAILKKKAAAGALVLYHLDGPPSKLPQLYDGLSSLKHLEFCCTLMAGRCGATEVETGDMIKSSLSLHGGEWDQINNNCCSANKHSFHSTIAVIWAVMLIGRCHNNPFSVIPGNKQIQQFV